MQVTKEQVTDIKNDCIVGLGVFMIVVATLPVVHTDALLALCMSGCGVLAYGILRKLKVRRT